jgi:hypothetical protein
MTEALKKLVAEFKQMPILLKFFTVHALACFLFLIVALIPGIPYNFNGEVMSFSEIWSSGVGIFTTYVGLVMPLCGWLMLNRKAYSRIIYLFVLASVLIMPYIYWMEKGGIIFGVVITALIAAYMYGMPSVRKYFASNKALQPTAESGG